MLLGLRDIYTPALSNLEQYSILKRYLNAYFIIEYGMVVMNQSAKRSKRKLWEGVLAGLFLVGLAVLFHIDQFWSWIPILAGIMVIGEALIRYHYNE